MICNKTLFSYNLTLQNDKDSKYSKEGTRKYFSQVFSHNTSLVDKAVAIAEECSKIGNWHKLNYLYKY